MAQLTKKQRSEASKKAAATRARNQSKSGSSKSAGQKSTPDTGRGTLLKQLEKDAPITVVRAGRTRPGEDPTNGRGVPNPPNQQYDGTDITKLDTGTADFEIAQVDGAHAVLKLGKEERLVDQADLLVASKRIAKAMQSTY